MSRAVLVLVVLLAGCKEKTAPPPPRSGLTERVRDKIVAAHPGVTVQIQDAETLVVTRGDYEVTMSLENLALTCRGGDAVCKDAIERAVGNIQLAGDERPAVTADKLVITIKPGQW